MIITKNIGNIHQEDKWQNYIIDRLNVEWYELNKRILRKFSDNNHEVGISLTIEQPLLKDGDVLHINDAQIIVINILPCECIAITPKNHLEIAKFCYEIGNRHAPLFIAEDNHDILLLAMDKPLLTMLTKIGAQVECVEARLVLAISNTTSAHHHAH